MILATNSNNLNLKGISKIKKNYNPIINLLIIKIKVENIIKQNM